MKKTVVPSNTDVFASFWYSILNFEGAQMYLAACSSVAELVRYALEFTTMCMAPICRRVSQRPATMAPKATA